MVINGEISLRLLPQAVLTANDVTLADPGDGVSVQVAALRLQVATLPLAAGEMVVRDLVLSAPVLHLPWALPNGIGRSARPLVPHEFAARIENGTLRIGAAEVTGITASLHGGPATAAAGADAAQVAAFGAEGFAAAGGRSWRFTAALGAPDADGVSAVDIAVRGQGAVADTGGSLQGTLADGVVQGRLRAGGPDLSLVMPAAAAAWTAEAPFVADATRVEANAISLSLGGAPADGALVLHIDAPARLEGHLHAASLDLDGWAALLGRGLGAGAGAGPAIGFMLPLQIGLAADSARLLDGPLTGVQATLVSDGRSLSFRQAQAGLPGGARLAADTVRLVRGQDGQLAASGLAHLAAPDLHATLAWLGRLAPALAQSLPDGALRQAQVSGLLSLQAGRGSVAGLTGQVDGNFVQGGLSIRLDGHPHLAAELDLALLPLDTWLGRASEAASLAAFAGYFTGAETSLHLRAARATLHGQMLENLDATASTGAGGLLLARAQAGLDGAALSLAGAIAADGSLHGVRFGARADALETVLPRLPATARWAPDLWHGAGALQVIGEGPPDGLSIQVRADVNDLVLEADSLRDTRAGTGSTTLTLRHPGAPRLVAELGLPQALGLPTGLAQTARWLDTGALTLRAHFRDSPSHLAVQDFDLNAAALRLSGGFTADWSGVAPMLDGTLAFDQLTLPGVPPDLEHAHMLAGWASHFHVTANSVSVGLRELARKAAADLSVAGGLVKLNALSAEIAGGRLSAAAEADLRRRHFTTHLQLAGASLSGGISVWPVDLTAGTADLDLQLELAGTDLANLAGKAVADLHDATATGFDLALLTASTPLHTKAGRLAARSALVTGASPGLSGTLAATISDGTVTLNSAKLQSRNGSAEIAGSVNLVQEVVDMHLNLWPLWRDAPGFAVGLRGPIRQPSEAAEPDRLETGTHAHARTHHAGATKIMYKTIISSSMNPPASVSGFQVPLDRSAALYLQVLHNPSSGFFNWKCDGAAFQPAARHSASGIVAGWLFATS